MNRRIRTRVCTVVWEAFPYPEWAAIKQDLCALQEITIEDKGRSLAINGMQGDVRQSILGRWGSHTPYHPRGVMTLTLCSEKNLWCQDLFGAPIYVK